MALNRITLLRGHLPETTTPEGILTRRTQPCQCRRHGRAAAPLRLVRANLQPVAPALSLCGTFAIVQARGRSCAPPIERNTDMPHPGHIAALTLACTLAAASASAAAPPPEDCRVGTYTLADQGTVDIGPSEGTSLRWRRPDGTTGVFAVDGPKAGISTLGWTGRPDGKRIRLSGCAQAQIDFDGMPGRRAAFEVRETRFDSEGVQLSGRLVMPRGDAPVPVVVLLHGSEDFSAVAFNSLQRRFPAEGIGAFVYDKRGTGSSQGRYTQDFTLLARDAVAALREARRLAGARASRVGYQGPSQGGWVAPIAAQMAPVDFVLVGFGLAVSVLEEDRSAVALNISAKGHGPQVMAQALALADACAAFVQDLTPAGFARFEPVRERFRREPWFGDVHGNFCFMLLALKKEELPAFAQRLDFGTPWWYDPMATLAGLRIPQLWILAQDDVDAPSAETARRLAVLRAAGRPIGTAMFPNTEHGILEYETAADGVRASTRQPDGYMRLMVDFVRGTPLKASYGTAVMQLPDARAR
jgi:pimeloyl-ACP methyl ester carboxylesterase